MKVINVVSQLSTF